MPTDQITPVLLEPSTSSISSVIQARSKSPRSLLVISILIGAFSAAGIAWGLWLRTFQLGQPNPDDWYNVFYVLFARHEPIALAIVVIFSLASAFVLFRNVGKIETTGSTSSVRHDRLLLVGIALIVFVTTALGTHLIAHNYALTADENLADFQAKIFLHGRTRAEVPAPWREVVRVIQPTFVSYFPATHSWNSSYLPVYAAMRALFQSVQLQSLLNPLLAAITLIALYGVARNIWPAARGNAWVAIALLASSTQFLLMSMTSYAMPAHLALNTIWLWLYSRPERRIFYLVPFIGVLAIGLHQPTVHALFAAPFLLRLVWQRRWGQVFFFGAVYLAGCATWYLWWNNYQTPSAGGVRSFFQLFNARMAIIQPMNLLLLLSWLSLPTALLAILGFRRSFRISPFLQDCAFSCIITFGFYYFFFAAQAHGWGYRYFYGMLSCLVLIAIVGWNFLSQMIGDHRAKIFVCAGVAASFLVQFPLRCVQVERFVRPYARTAALLHAIPAEVVAFDPRDAWYSADLVRNDPFLQERPIVVSLFRLTPKQVAVLQNAGTVRLLDREVLTRLGMATKRFDHYEVAPFGLGGNDK